MKRMGGAALIWVVLALFEIALIGRLDAQETPVGLAIALLAAAVLVAALRAARLQYAIAPSWTWLIVLIVRNVVRDTFVVFGVLLRRMVGAAIEDDVQAVAFNAGADDPRSPARRALAVAGVSTSPNGIVLAVDAKNAVMHVHVLATSSAAKHSAEWPL